MVPRVLGVWGLDGFRVQGLGHSIGCAVRVWGRGFGVMEDQIGNRDMTWKLGYTRLVKGGKEFRFFCHNMKTYCSK